MAGAYSAYVHRAHCALEACPQVEKARLETQMATMKSQLEKAKAEHAVRAGCR